jgi:hypothetical protein
MAYIADDIVRDAPAGRVEGAAAYRAFLTPFAEQLLISATMIAAFGDDRTALLMYDTETVPARSAPAAECPPSRMARSPAADSTSTAHRSRSSSAGRPKRTSRACPAGVADLLAQGHRRVCGA